jgi:hypothetical protein
MHLHAASKPAHTAREAQMQHRTKKEVGRAHLVGNALHWPGGDGARRAEPVDRQLSGAQALRQSGFSNWPALFLQGRCHGPAIGEASVKDLMRQSRSAFRLVGLTCCRRANGSREDSGRLWISVEARSAVAGVRGNPRRDGLGMWSKHPLAKRAFDTS